MSERPTASELAYAQAITDAAEQRYARLAAAADEAVSLDPQSEAAQEAIRAMEAAGQDWSRASLAEWHAGLARHPHPELDMSDQPPFAPELAQGGFYVGMSRGRQITAEEIDNEPPATAEQWLTSDASDRHPGGFDPPPFYPELAREEPEAGQ